MEDRSITITTGTIIKTVLILIAVWALFELQHIVLVVLTAIVIASAVEPAVHALMRAKVPRLLGVIIVYIVMLALFFGVFYFFVPLVLEDVASFVASVPSYIASINHLGNFDQYTQALGIAPIPAISVDNVMASLRQGLDLNATFGNAFGAASAIFGGVFSFVLIIVFSFYFAVLETGVDDFLRIVVPKKRHAYILGLWRRSQHKIGLWMQGQILLALIIGTLVFLGLTILGVPHALILAVIAACFEIIPVFGPTLSAVPAIAIALASGGLTLGLLTLALYVIAQEFENHLIYPLVVTRVVGVPPLLVIIALIVGWQLAGFLGVILSVPVAATIQELVRDYESGRLSKE